MIFHGFSPFLNHISAKFSDKRSPVVCSRESAIYFRTREYKAPSLAKRYYFFNLFNSCIILFPYFIIAPLGLRVAANLMVKAGISTEIFSSVNASRFHNGLVYQNWRFSRLGKIGRERNLKRNFFGRHYYARSGRHFSGIPNKRRFFSSNRKSESSGLIKLSLLTYGGKEAVILTSERSLMLLANDQTRV